MPHSLTPLTKEWSRVTTRQYRTLHSKPKQVVVKLLPTDELEFHELRGRQKYRVPIQAAFIFAIRLAVISRSKQSEIL